MQQSSLFDCVAFDPFSFQQDCLIVVEVHVGRCQIAQALVMAPVVVVTNEEANVGLEIPRLSTAVGIQGRGPPPRRADSARSRKRVF